MVSAHELRRRLEAFVPGQAPPGVAPAPSSVEVRFERLTMAGLEEMHRYSIDPRLYEFLEHRPFASIDETRAYISRLQERMGQPDDRTAMYWFVRRIADGQLVGTAGLVDISPERQSVGWGYGVDPALWGKGYILQMQELLKHYVFEVLELNRLGSMTMLENERTISSVLAAGMKHEGIARAYYRKDGVFRDGWMYGMLASDYFAQKQAVATRPAARHSVDDVIAMVASVLTEDTIGPDSTSGNTPSWDSLSHMAIIETVSQRTGIELSPSQIMRANSVRTLTAMLNEG